MRGGGKGAGRAEDAIVLSVVERQLLHVIERETADVYLSRLLIGEGDAVVAHSRMMCPQAAHRDRFQSPDAAIITDGDTRQMLHRIGELQCIQLPDLISCENVTGCRGPHLTVAQLLGDHHFGQSDGVGYRLGGSL